MAAYRSAVLVVAKLKEMKLAAAAGMSFQDTVVWVKSAGYVALFVAISFVFITEMFNTALEYAIDIFTSRYDPLAKLAKDVAAGAVLVATLNALVVAYLVFYDRVTGVPYTVLNKVRQTPIDVAAINTVPGCSATTISCAAVTKGSGA